MLRAAGRALLLWGEIVLFVSLAAGNGILVGVAIASFMTEESLPW